MKAYKVFNHEWKCRNYKYKHTRLNVNSIANSTLIRCCSYGFHACPNPSDLTNYINVKNRHNHYAIVDIYGKCDSIEDKIAAEHLVILKEYPTYKALLEEYDRTKSLNVVKHINKKCELYQNRINKLKDKLHKQFNKDIVSNILRILFEEFAHNKKAVVLLFAWLVRSEGIKGRLELLNPMKDGGLFLNFVAESIKHKRDKFLDEQNKKASYYKNTIRINNKIKHLYKIDIMKIYEYSKKLYTDIENPPRNTFIAKPCSKKERQLIMKGVL